MNHQAQPYSATGERVSHSTQYGVANWTGALLDQHFDTYEDAHKASLDLTEKFKKLGFTSDADALSVITVVRREVSVIAGAWSRVG
ncbi:hypothetical protein [Glutamicibacter arilaitensis]|uniref:hypothetical protein n=1 Tax=Glutamicibacter arilaitensis TaxID=256701 RepID=UPI003F919648